MKIVIVIVKEYLQFDLNLRVVYKIMNIPIIILSCLYIDLVPFKKGSVQNSFFVS